MFSASTYIERRKKLKELVKTGIIFLPGNGDVPINYADNMYQFRQDSSFLYYFGLDKENLAGIIDVDKNQEFIFGDDRSIADVVWMGPEEPLADSAKKVGIENTAPMSTLSGVLKSANEKAQKIHWLPQYRAELIIKFEDWLGVHHSKVNEDASVELIKAVIAQREFKSEEELKEIELALDLSYEMNTTAMKLSREGIYEREIWGVVAGIAHKWGGFASFPIIFSQNGQTLHNHHHDHIMKNGRLLILDSGAESPLHYASDITRTFPVSGRFTDKQKEIYETVLAAELKGIEMIKPGITYKECHLAAAKVIAENLISIGLMKGNADNAVAAGAHALFMPHGLGHHMGLDVHDCEGLGESYIGYDEKHKRSEQFGLAYLRMGKELKTGHVVTVEPGCYFIPQLIDNWKAENKHAEFINYDKLDSYKDFGGVRIEDDVAVTESGYRVLGKPIPKTVKDVEAACNA